MTFKNSEGKCYEINNYDDLKQLSTKYGKQTATNNLKHMQMHIEIQVLALTFTDYQKRFKYEQDLFITDNNIKLQKNNALTNAEKQILSKFVLSPLVTTKAVIKKEIKQKEVINIMDMLNVNEKPAAKQPEDEPNAVLKDVLQNVVQKPSQSTSVSINKQHPKTHYKLSTIYDLPLVSFEELRCENYVKQEKWKEGQATKLVILNWPQAMNRDTLKTMFAAYGNIIECDVNHDNHCCFVQFDTNAAAKKAIEALDGFKIGKSKLSVQFLRFAPQKEAEEKDALKEEESSEENKKLVIGNWPKTMSNGLLSTLFAPYGDIKEAKIVNECAFVEYETNDEAQKAYDALNRFQMGPNRLNVSFASNETSHILHMNENIISPNDEIPQNDTNETEHDEFQHVDYPQNEAQNVPKPEQVSIFEAHDDDNEEIQENNNKTPNEEEIAEIVSKEHEKERKRKEIKTDSSSSSEESDSISSSLYSSDSSTDSLEKLKKKHLKKKLSKKELKALKKKQKKRKRQKLKARKKRKKLEERQKYVDKNITALNDCLEKFTNLMSSVSQSAMIMQQSVAQISQIHAQQQQQSMVYQQSMRSLFPNQPMYTSIVPTGSTSSTQQPGTQSIQKIITQMSNTQLTQGGPENKAKQLNEEFLAQQNVEKNKANAWVNNNFPKPSINTKIAQNVVSTDIRSSPILHATHNLLANNDNNDNNNNNNNGNDINLMNLSGDSNNAEQPGNNPSKSKIFEHKKALRNVSKEMDEKLTQLNNLGYKNRTFNLVLLKQENGEMEKVVAALKQFYQSN